MLYQLSYTPRPELRVKAGARGNQGAFSPARCKRTTFPLHRAESHNTPVRHAAILRRPGTRDAPLRSPWSIRTTGPERPSGRQGNRKTPLERTASQPPTFGGSLWRFPPTASGHAMPQKKDAGPVGPALVDFRVVSRITR